MATTFNMSKKDATAGVELVFDTISKWLAKGEEVKFSGFGNFAVKMRKERMGVNPKTGEKVHIAAKKALKFRAAKALKEMVR